MTEEASWVLAASVLRKPKVMLEAVRSSFILESHGDLKSNLWKSPAFNLLTHFQSRATQSFNGVGWRNVIRGATLKREKKKKHKALRCLNTLAWLACQQLFYKQNNAYWM